MVKDMTSGNPTRHLLSFAVPMLIGNIFQQVYNMVDAMVVGRGVGTLALAAVGATGAMNFFILGFVVGLASGFSIIVAQRFGAGDEEGLRSSIAMSTYLCIAATVIVTAGSILGSMPLLRLMKTPANIIQDANTYITIVFAGTGATIFYNFLSAILRSLGDSKSPLYVLIISSLLNVALDILFVITLGMGVAGAAYATVIAQVVSCLLCLLLMRRYEILKMTKKDWRFHPVMTGQLLKLGVPGAFQNSVTALGVMVLQTVINGYGADHVAAYTAASKIIQIAQQPGMTFGLAMATYTGQNLGAGKLDRIRSGLKKCIMLSMIFCAATTLLVVVFGRSMTGWFISNPSEIILNISMEYLVTLSLFLWALGLLFIYRSGLQGMGNAVIPFVSGALELGLRIAAALVLPIWIGFLGVCVAEAAAWVGATVLLVVFFYKNIRMHENRARLRDSYDQEKETLQMAEQVHAYPPDAE